MMAVFRSSLYLESSLDDLVAQVKEMECYLDQLVLQLIAKVIYVHISEPSLQRVSIFTSAGRFVRSFQVCAEDQDSATDDKSTSRLATLAFDKYKNLYAGTGRKGQVLIL